MKILSKKKIKIGLEVHIQITKLKTKLFCGCSSNYRNESANTFVCPTCLGIPGALPVLNKAAIEFALKVALALNCRISKSMLFFRKNYFYPDMTKNFQITQYDRAGGVPLALDGYLYIRVKGLRKKIQVSRVHLEEDPGKLIHQGPIDKSSYTLVDYNRAGITLLEIVTEPDLSSPREARVFLQTLRIILDSLDVMNSELEGSIRCDANISIEDGTRVEVKNISSFKEVDRALSFEIIRQRDMLEKRLSVKRDTRHWDETRRRTISLRTKEEEHDYRYFPEPDLVPIRITDNFISKLKSSIPELPEARMKRFIKEYGIPRYDAEVLVSNKSLSDFYEEAVNLYHKPKEISNWIMSDLLGSLNENDLDLVDSKISSQHFVDMIKLIDLGVISGKIAKMILLEMVLTGKPPKQIVDDKSLRVIDTHKILDKILKQVFSKNKTAVKDALTDPKAVNFLIGQVMEKTKGKADPELSNLLINKKLNEMRINESD